MDFHHGASLDLSIIIPARNEQGNIGPLVTRVRGVVAGMGIAAEVLVVDGGSRDATASEARDAGALVVDQEGQGYGAALCTGFAHARGRHLATLDGDMSHDPAFLAPMYRVRDRGEVIIGSRYVSTAHAEQGWFRYVLSLILNFVFRHVLVLPLRDLSSGFRLYHRSALESIDPVGRDFDVLIEILVRVYGQGFHVYEVPIHYHPRREGVSNARLAHFAISYLKTLYRLWKLRNDGETADYDARAFNSLILPQRVWQRLRYRTIRELLEPTGRILDIGCGSSLVLVSIPGAFGLDLSLPKLRYMRGSGSPLVAASLEALPFADGTFDQVICSQVLEHVRPEILRLDEVVRLLRPGGVLIVGTPDYGRPWWRVIEWIYRRVHPGADSDHHLTRFTRDSLVRALEAAGVAVDSVRYVMGGEIIVRAIRPVPAVATAGNGNSRTDLAAG